MAQNATETVRENAPAPIVKWAGGKGRLLPYLLPEVLPRLLQGGAYKEPFVGGGALFFAIRAAGWGGKATLNDACAPLVNLYRCVSDLPDAVYRCFRAYVSQDSREFYYSVRQAPPEDAFVQAGWFLYLNHAGFNGLWRENAKGHNNVPYGDGRPIGSPTLDALTAAASALDRARVQHGDFAATEVQVGDVVYCDSPYLPLTATANFTGYTSGGFSGADQLRLAAYAVACREAGARVVLSNAGNEDSTSCFASVADRVVVIPAAPRRISCKGDQRKPVREYLFIFDRQEARRTT
jgi:DNA adenine methylase